jgi:hypothetical protein
MRLIAFTWIGARGRLNARSSLMTRPLDLGSGQSHFSRLARQGFEALADLARLHDNRSGAR